MSRRLGPVPLGRTDRRAGVEASGSFGSTVVPATAVPPHPGWATSVSAVAARAVLVLVAGLLLWAALPVGLRWSSHVVVSASMEPAIRTGDVVLAAPVQAEELRAGQVVTFADPDQPDRTVVHRVQSVSGDGMVVTKGDANPTADTGRLTTAGVEGLARLRVPWVGLPVVWVREGNWGALALLLLALTGLGWLAGRDRHPHDDLVLDLRDDGRKDPPDDPDDPIDRPGTRAPRLHPARLATAGGAALLVATTAVAGPGHAAFASASGTGSNTWAMSPYAVFGLEQYQPIVLADSPLFLYRLSQPSGVTIDDVSVNNRNGTARPGAGSWIYGVTPQPLPRNTGTAMQPNAATAFIATPASAGQSNPSQFSAEIWFRTTSTSGGKLLGFENSRTGTGSSRYDRHVYLLSSGALRAGVGPSSNRQVLTSPGTYNDGIWHQAVLTRTSAGIVTLYVDGEAVAVSGGPLAVDNFGTGYWRFGGGNLTGWAGAPASSPSTSRFPGPIANAAAWTRALTAAEVREHYYAA